MLEGWHNVECGGGRGQSGGSGIGDGRNIFFWTNQRMFHEFVSDLFPFVDVVVKSLLEAMNDMRKIKTLDVSGGHGTW